MKITAFFSLLTLLASADARWVITIDDGGAALQDIESYTDPKKCAYYFKDRNSFCLYDEEFVASVNKGTDPSLFADLNDKQVQLLAHYYSGIHEGRLSLADFNPKRLAAFMSKTGKNT